MQTERVRNHDHDFGWLVTATEEYVDGTVIGVEFAIYEITSEGDDDEPLFVGFGGDYGNAVTLDRAEPTVRGTARWDGAYHVYFKGEPVGVSAGSGEAYVPLSGGTFAGLRRALDRVPVLAARMLAPYFDDVSPLLD